MDNRFLAINKEYFGKGLKSIDILILAQIEEFQRNKCQCYVTNEQFSEMFGESDSTIKRSLKKLEDAKYICRNTHVVEGNGKANRQRILALGANKVTVGTPIRKCKGQNKKMEGSNINDGKVKKADCEGHIEPIKNNLKEKVKENLKNNKPEEENANAIKDEKWGKREIKDLTYNEGEEISKAIRSNKDTYANLQKKYGLVFGSVTKNFPKQWQSEKNARAYMAEIKREEEQRRNEPKIDYSNIYVKPKSQEEIEHEQMMERLLIEDLFEDDDERHIDEEHSTSVCSANEPISQEYKTEYQGQRFRLLGDLSLEEGDQIAKEICDENISYEEIWKKHNIKPELVSKSFLDRWKQLRQGMIRIKEMEERGLQFEDMTWEEEEGTDSVDEVQLSPEVLRIFREMKAMNPSDS